MIFSSEKISLEAATFLLIRGGVVSTDLASIQMSDGTSTFCALTILWGFISDITAEAEKFRNFGMGFTRYYLGVLYVCMC